METSAEEITAICDILFVEPHILSPRYQEVSHLYENTDKNAFDWVCDHLRAHFKVNTDPHIENLQTFGFTAEVSVLLEKWLLSFENHTGHSDLLYWWAWRRIQADPRAGMYHYPRDSTQTGSSSSINSTDGSFGVQEKSTVPSIEKSESETLEDYLPRAKLSFRGGGGGDEEGSLILYHGTASDGAFKIFTHGFDIGFSSPINDFGRGIYLTGNFNEAAYFAKRRAGSPHFSDTPVVLTYSVPAEKFRSFKFLSFNDEDEWHNFVGANKRTGFVKKSFRKYEWISGWVSKAVSGDYISTSEWQYCLRKEEVLEWLEPLCGLQTTIVYDAGRV